MTSLRSCALLAFVFPLALLASCASQAPMQAAPLVQAQAATAPRTPGKTEVLWLGHSAFRITSPGGKVIVIDPWLAGNPKTPPQFKQLSALGKVDLVLVTHAHFDHVADAPELAKLNNAPLFNAGGMGQIMVSLGLLPPNLAQRFGLGGTITPLGAGGPKVTAVPAVHSSEFVWKNPATNKDETHFGGEPVGYIVEMENGFRIWHMGDTAAYGDMKMIAERYHPDLVLAPIGGYFTMGAEEAGTAIGRMIHPRYAIPMHFATFPALTGTPAQLKSALAGSGVTVVDMEPGQKVEF